MRHIGTKCGRLVSPGCTYTLTHTYICIHEKLSPFCFVFFFWSSKHSLNVTGFLRCLVMSMLLYCSGRKDKELGSPALSTHDVPPCYVPRHPVALAAEVLIKLLTWPQAGLLILYRPSFLNLIISVGFFLFPRSGHGPGNESFPSCLVIRNTAKHLGSFWNVIHHNDCTFSLH